MLGNPDIAGLVLDDLSPALERDIEAAFGELATSLARRGLPLIVTSNQPPGQRLARALSLGDAGIFPAPSFEKEDAAALVAAYGGDPAKWGWFALIAGAGHPQLVDTVIAGLVRRGWPDSAMREWMDAGLKNDDVESERETIRRRLLEWSSVNHYRDDILRVLHALVRCSWLEVIEKQRALLVVPGVSAPRISEALEADLHPAAYVANLLLAAEPAISLNLSAEYRVLLGEIAGSATPTQPSASYGRPNPATS